MASKKDKDKKWGLNWGAADLDNAFSERVDENVRENMRNGVGVEEETPAGAGVMRPEPEKSPLQKWDEQPDWGQGAVSDIRRRAQQVETAARREAQENASRPIWERGGVAFSPETRHVEQGDAIQQQVEQPQAVESRRPQQDEATNKLTDGIVRNATKQLDDYINQTVMRNESMSEPEKIIAARNGEKDLYLTKANAYERMTPDNVKRYLEDILSEPMTLGAIYDDALAHGMKAEEYVDKVLLPNIEQKVAAEMVARHTPKSTLSYLASSTLHKSLLGRVMLNLSNMPKDVRALKQEGLAQYDEGLSRQMEEGNLSEAVAAGAEKLGAMALPFVADAGPFRLLGAVSNVAGLGRIARVSALSGNGLLSTAVRMGLHEGGTFGLYEGTSGLLNDIAQDDVSVWQAAKNFGMNYASGALTGFALGSVKTGLAKRHEGAAMLNKGHFGKPQEALRAGEKFAATTAVFAVSDVMKRWATDPNFDINNVDWSDVLANAALTTMMIEVSGMSGKLNAARAQKEALANVHFTEADKSAFRNAGIPVVRDGDARKWFFQNAELYADLDPKQQLWYRRAMGVVENKVLSVEQKNMLLKAAGLNPVVPVMETTKVSDVQPYVVFDSKGNPVTQYRVDEFDGNGTFQKRTIFATEQEAQQYREEMGESVTQNWRKFCQQQSETIKLSKATPMAYAEMFRRGVYPEQMTEILAKDEKNLIGDERKVRDEFLDVRQTFMDLTETPYEDALYDIAEKYGVPVEAVRGAVESDSRTKLGNQVMGDFMQLLEQYTKPGMLDNQKDENATRELISDGELEQLRSEGRKLYASGDAKAMHEQVLRFRAAKARHEGSKADEHLFEYYLRQKAIYDAMLETHNGNHSEAYSAADNFAKSELMADADGNVRVVRMGDKAFVVLNADMDSMIVVPVETAQDGTIDFASADRSRARTMMRRDAGEFEMHNVDEVMRSMYPNVTAERDAIFGDTKPEVGQVVESVADEQGNVVRETVVNNDGNGTWLLQREDGAQRAVTEEELTQMLREQEQRVDDERYFKEEVEAIKAKDIERREAEAEERRLNKGGKSGKKAPVVDVEDVPVPRDQEGNADLNGMAEAGTSVANAIDALSEAFDGDLGRAQRVVAAKIKALTKQSKEVVESTGEESGDLNAMAASARERNARRAKIAREQDYWLSLLSEMTGRRKEVLAGDIDNPDNYRQPKEIAREQIERLAGKLGVKVVFTDNMYDTMMADESITSKPKDPLEASSYNGYRRKDGTIVINTNSEHALVWTMGHETGHQVEEAAPQQYEVLKAAILDTLDPLFVAQKMESLRGEEVYKNSADSELLSEIANDGLGRIFTDERAFGELMKRLGVEEAKTLADKIKSWVGQTAVMKTLKQTWDSLTQKAQEANPLLMDGERGERLLSLAENAYKEAMENQDLEKAGVVTPVRHSYDPALEIDREGDANRLPEQMEETKRLMAVKKDYEKGLQAGRELNWRSLGRGGINEISVYGLEWGLNNRILGHRPNSIISEGADGGRIKVNMSPQNLVDTRDHIDALERLQGEYVTIRNSPVVTDGARRVIDSNIYAIDYAKRYYDLALQGDNAILKMEAPQFSKEEAEPKEVEKHPIFLSNAEVAVRNIKQEKATAEQWLAMAEKMGGIKAGEDKWMGLSDWLRSKKGEKLTKDEVLKYIMDNSIQVEDVHYEEMSGDDIWALPAMKKYSEEFKQRIEETGNAAEAFDAMVSDYGDDFASAFEYDNNELSPVTDWDGELSGAARHYLDINKNVINEIRLGLTTEGLTNKREIALVVPTADPYHGDLREIHFDDDATQGRAIAWARFGETTGDGNRVLVIDEVQSQRFEDAKGKGFEQVFPVEGVHVGEYVPVKDERYKHISFANVFEHDGIHIGQIEKIADKFRPLDSQGRQIGYEDFDTEAEAVNLVKKDYATVEGVPDAPFAKNWFELTMKRMLRYAAENGYDKMAWTTGEQQAARYNIGTVVKDIYIAKSLNSESWKTVVLDTKGGMLGYDVDKDGIVQATSTSMGTPMNDGTVGKSLSELIGKDLAAKVLSSPDNTKIEGEGLRIGAEGKGIFYDEILPRFMNKYGKKWGVKVYDIELPNVEEAGRHMWAVDITPEMKESVMQGQVMFSKEEEKTLMGVHNISEEKLRKAIKQGGLANPSLAVIDTRNGMHTQYGEISLIPKSDLIDSKSGGNAGTYAGDAWTPTYPSVTRMFTKQGEAHSKQIAKEWSGGDKDVERHLLQIQDEYIDGDSDRMHFLFLKQRGMNPEIKKERTTHTHEDYEEMVKLIGDQFWNVSELTTEQNDALLKKMMDEYEKKIGAEESGSIDKEKLQALKNRWLKDRRESLADENGKLYFSKWQSYLYETFRDEQRRNSDAIDWHATDNDARNRVAKEGLSEEYNKWKERLFDDADVEEKIFTGYTPSGNRRYVPNTLENVSRYMNKDAEQNAYGNGGFSATKALLLDRFTTLAQIRKNRERLKPADKVNENYDEMSDRWFGIIKELSDMQKISDNSFSNIDYAESRLQEAILKRDPIAYLNKEYGYDIAGDGEYASELMNFIDEVKTLPVKYFETKFRRPVMLDEFAIAVVPEKTDAGIVEALKNAGLDVRTYDGTDEGRSAVTLEAVRGRDDVRFSKENAETLFKEAKKRFGRTYDLREAGYILPDGTMLNFSGKHWLDDGADASSLAGRRTVDHRDIRELAYERDGNTKTGIETDMTDFIRSGAIRIDDNAGLINLSAKPTPEQRELLRRLVSRNGGQVQVEIGDGDTSEAYVEYDNAKPSRVLADIDRYFDEGIVPQGDVLFSKEDFSINSKKTSEDDWQIGEKFVSLHSERDREAVREQRNSMSPTAQWREGVGDVMIHSILPIVRKKYADLHEKAKAGDVEAAFRLVKAVVKEDRIRALAEQHPNAKVAFVHAEEATGENRIPEAYARLLTNFGFGHTDIVQTNKPQHTGSDRIGRLIRRARFDGDVEAGTEYILVDDHVTMGGTLRDLKDYIEGKGGKVVAVTTLTASAGGSKLQSTAEQIEQLKQKGITNEQLKELGIADDIAGLTKGEARELLVLADARADRRPASGRPGDLGEARRSLGGREKGNGQGVDYSKEAPAPKEGEDWKDYAGRVSRWMNQKQRGATDSQIDDLESIRTAIAETDTNPSEAEKKSGNYKMGHAHLDGYQITIENPVGSVRRGTDPDGKAWETKMHYTYGYIRGTKGKDGDHVDIFLSENPTQGNVYVVDQVDPKTGKFDEHKVMYGFQSEAEARDAYLSNYEEGWKGLGDITGVSKEEFRKWVDSSKRKTKPFKEYANIETIKESPVADKAPEPKEGESPLEYSQRVMAWERTQSEAQELSDGEVKFSKRTKDEPKKKGIGYKVFYLKDGKLYPPMVANPGGEDTPMGVWLDADAAPVVAETKSGRKKVKAGGKGTQGGSGQLAYRPGWHLGEIPYASQFNRENAETGEKELFPARFVWAEVEYANDKDYQKEAESYGMTENGKFRHSYAGLPRVPEDGAYKYRTNPDPNTDPWIITGAMRVNRLLTPSEVDEMVTAAGREPQKREQGAVTDAEIEALNGGVRFSKNTKRSSAQLDLFGNPQLDLFRDRQKDKTVMERIRELADGDLLQEIGSGEMRDWDFYQEEYDRRHNNEYSEEVDSYTGMLMQGKTSLNDAYRMYADIEKRWRSGGYATEERTALRAQMDALTDYIDRLEFAEGDEVQGLEGYTRQEVLDAVRGDVEEMLEDSGVDVEIKGMALNGSRLRGDARKDSDLDVVLEYDGDVSEDALFNILNENPIEFDGIKVDINPITEGKSGTLEQYMARSRQYDEEVGVRFSKESEDFAEKYSGGNEDKKAQIADRISKINTIKKKFGPESLLSEESLVSLQREIKKPIDHFYNVVAEKIADEYINEKFGSGTNVIDPDELRERTFAVVGYDGTNVSLYGKNDDLIAKVYRKALAKAIADNNPTVILLTGHAGAGKSTSLRTSGIDTSKAGVVYDSAFNTYESLARAINTAKEAGVKESDIRVVAVYNDPVTSFSNTLARAKKEGRTVPFNYFFGHAFVSNNGKIRDLSDNFPEVNIVCLDNSRNSSKGEVSLDEAKDWDYGVSEQQFEEALKLIEDEINRKERGLTEHQIASITRGLSGTRRLPHRLDGVAKRIEVRLSGNGRRESVGEVGGDLTPDSGVKYSKDSDIKKGKSEQWKRTWDEVKDNARYRDMLLDLEPHTIEEVAAGILRGGGLLWGDVKDSEGKVLVKGVRSFMGYKEGERKKFFGLFTSEENGGRGFERVGEEVETECQRLGIPYDENDPMAGVNALQSVLSECGGKGQLNDYIQYRRVLEVSSQIKADEDAEQEAIDEEYYDRYGMDKSTYDQIFDEVSGEKERQKSKETIDLLQRKVEQQNEKMERMWTELKAERTNKEGKAAIERLIQQNKAAREENAALRAELNEKRDDGKKLDNTRIAMERRENVRKQLIAYIREQIAAQWMPFTTKQDLNRLMSAVQQATTPEALEKAMRSVQYVSTSGMVRAQQQRLDRLMALKVQDVNGKNMSIAKNVDDRTRVILQGVRQRVMDNKMVSLLEQLDGLRRDRIWLNAGLRKMRQRGEAPEVIAEEEAKLQRNAERMADLEQQIEDIREQKPGTQESDIQSEIAELNKKADKAATGDAVWTTEDADMMTQLQLMQALVEPREYTVQEARIGRELSQEIDKVKELVARRNAVTDEDVRRDLADEIKTKREKIEGLQDARNEAQKARSEALSRVIELFQNTINGGKESLQAKVQAEAERRMMLIREAVRSVGGGKGVSDGQSREGQRQQKNATRQNAVVETISAPLGSFDYMCQKIDTEGGQGKDGWIYRRFVSGEEGAMESYNTYLTGVQEQMDALNKKVVELFGTKRGLLGTDAWVKQAAEADKVVENCGVTHADSKVIGKRVSDSLSKGQATYIWAVWQMPDGKLKLKLQGYDEGSIREIEKFIGPKYIELAKWLSSEFFANSRAKYNERYREMYNTSMARIENYVPLKVNDMERRNESALEDPSKGAKSLEVRTGSLINRKFNVVPVDVTNSIFDIVTRHVEQMENWYAYARLRRDLDAVLSNNYFRNQVNANAAGDLDRLYKAAEVATLSYVPEKARYDALTNFLNKGLIAGNIAYRLNTALKQFLSAPSYLGYSGDPRYLMALAKNTATGALGLNLKWCYNNIPSFRKRVDVGDLGDNRWSEESNEKVTQWLQRYASVGMLPNRLIDAITCSIGIKSIYDYNFAKATKGLADSNLTLMERAQLVKEAEKRAKMEADIYYNQTQQSSHPVFLSPMQMERTTAARLWTVYQNSNLGYTRKMMEHAWDLWRHVDYDKFTSAYKRMYLQNGMTKEEAEHEAKMKYWRSLGGDFWGLALYCYGMKLLWNAGSKGLLGFLQNDDDDKKKAGESEERFQKRRRWETFNDVATWMFTPLQGTPMGRMGLEVAGVATVGGGGSVSSTLFVDAMAQMLREIRAADLDPMLTTAILGKYGAKVAGVDFQTWGNIYIGVEGLVKDGYPYDDKLIDIMYILNTPRSGRMEAARTLFMEYRPNATEEEFQKVVGYADGFMTHDSWLAKYMPGVKDAEGERYAKEYKTLSGEYQRMQNGSAPEKEESAAVRGRKAYRTYVRYEDIAGDADVENWHQRALDAKKKIGESSKEIREFGLSSSLTKQLIDVEKMGHEYELNIADLYADYNKKRGALIEKLTGDKDSDQDVLADIRRLREDFLSTVKDKDKLADKVWDIKNE